MKEHASLQAVSPHESASPEATSLAMTILAGDISVDDAIAQAAEHLLTVDRVDAVVTALTTVPPIDQRGWTGQGCRDSVPEWSRPRMPFTVVPPPGPGP